ncbi:MAG: hypothetical protein CR986_06630 [Ignavibacteriae bacterium]|nr:MAG: hypothetical protein CR986_06630 [Ignavibacteriota bacterium]
MYYYFSKIIWVPLLLIITMSCNLLTTREAEEPINVRSSYRPATTPEQLFLNLTNSFSEKNEKDYISCFVDSSFLNEKYKFTPSSEALFNYNFLSDWDLTSEQIYFKNLINTFKEGDNIVITLNLISSSIEGNIGNRNYDYTIKLPEINENNAVTYKGNSSFTINLDNNNQWVITSWIDIQTGKTNPAWSDLKGRFF